MIHLTPIQEIGESESAYSLYDHNMISNSFFDKHLTGTFLIFYLLWIEKEKFKLIEMEFKKFKSEYGVLTMGDLVLNHAASNSAWLADHPEATYNTNNLPHLLPALVVDQVF